ncbi:choice-of-anchor X domain-containing protein [Nocardioides sp. R-C-SC26]|uniref:DUF7379 domain-containing protein n=1 Tax=Nocardioides sp. R-C-SC26 TaxID=2870414 RepID=UPI001E47938D|nr:choice-of-anchor X domain-containing protein [Nocardioides sp. R-C-SC26]
MRTRLSSLPAAVSAFMLSVGLLALVVPTATAQGDPAPAASGSAPPAAEPSRADDGIVGPQPLLVVGPGASAAPTPGCRDLDLSYLAQESISFNEGMPWILDAGPEIDLTASWVRGESRTVTYDPGSGQLPVFGWGDPTDFPLFRGVNDLRIHGDELGETRVTWHLARTDGEPACDGELITRVRHLATASTPANVRYRQEHSIVKITAPAQGAKLEVGRPVEVTFGCAYTGTLPTKSECFASGGFGATHTATFAPHALGDGYVCFYASTEAVGVPPESTYGWFNGVDCLWYRGVAATVPPALEKSVRLETQVFPSTEWSELPDGANVVAGNPVRVVTTLRNVSGEEKSIDLALRDVATGQALPDSEESFDLPPGATYERSTRWDTTDRAWLAPGLPNVQASQVEVDVRVGREKQAVRRAVVVQPRPVVLVHGWKSYAESSWGTYQDIVETGHPWLRGYAVGDGRFPGRMNTNGGGTGCQTCRTNTVAENAAEEARYIEGVRAATGAWRVDVLAHSMGGLISRYYLQELMPLDNDGRPVVHRLIQMGTPNRGSQLADMLMAFGAAGADKIPFFPASYHLTPEWVEGYFNQIVTDTRGVPISNLVGTSLPLVGMPLLPWLAGDGIVPADSARWTLADTMDSPYDFHTAMTESADDFTKYVLPRLSTPVSPSERRAAALGPLSVEPGVEEDPVIFEQRSQPNGVRTASVPAGGTVNLPYQLENATTMGALAVADDLRLTLLDAAGEVLATDEEQGADGVVQVATPNFRATRGAGTLRVTDLSGQARDVTLLTFVAGSPLTLEAATSPWSRAGTTSGPARSEAPGQVTARLVRLEQPAAGTVTARVIGRAQEVTMVDDGAHGDGPAGDGVYGARLGDLPEGQHAVVITATTPGGSTRIATTTIAGNGRGGPVPGDPGDPGPVDPGPVDPGPVDPGPVDPGPVDPGPVDPGPVDPGPVDPGPVDPGPVDPGPVDPGPVDPGPVDPGPVDPGPVDPGPVDPGPVDPGPVDPGPVDPGPVDPGPVDPGPVDPGPVDPGPVDPGPVDPGPVDPGPVDPGPVDPGPVDPGPVDPGPVDPGPVDPGPVDPGPVDPGPVDPGPVDPGPVDPGPVDPGPVDPGPVDPGPVDPGPVDPGPVDPDPVTPGRPSTGTRLLARFESIVRLHHLRPTLTRPMRAALRNAIRWEEADRRRVARREVRRFHRHVVLAGRRGHVTTPQRVALLRVWRAARRLVTTSGGR